MKVLNRVSGAVSAKVAALVAMATAGASAMADGTGIDVTSTTATIAGQQSSVTSVGLAILAVVVGIAAFVWIRKAIH